MGLTGSSFLFRAPGDDACLCDCAWAYVRGLLRCVWPRGSVCDAPRNIHFSVPEFYTPNTTAPNKFFVLDLYPPRPRPHEGWGGRGRESKTTQCGAPIVIFPRGGKERAARMPSSRGASSLLRLCVLAVALSVCAFEALPGVTAAPCTSHQTVRGRILQQKPQRRRGPRLPDDGPKQKANPRRIALQQGDDDNDDDDDDDDERQQQQQQLQVGLPSSMGWADDMLQVALPPGVSTDSWFLPTNTRGNRLDDDVQDDPAVGGIPRIIDGALQLASGLAGDAADAAQREAQQALGVERGIVNNISATIPPEMRDLNRNLTQDSIQWGNILESQGLGRDDITNLKADAIRNIAAQAVRDEDNSFQNTLRGNDGLNPVLAGFRCTTDGTNINAMEGLIHYASSMMDKGTMDTSLASKLKQECLWIVNFPPSIEDGTLVVFNVDTFESTHKARLQVYSGSTSCSVTNDNLYGDLQLEPSSASFDQKEEEHTKDVYEIPETYLFVPVEENAITIHFEVDFSDLDTDDPDDNEYDPLDKRVFGITANFYPLVPNPGVHVTDNRLIHDMTLYSSNLTSFSQIYNATAFGNGLPDGVDTVDAGIFIVNNQNLEDLDGLEAIKEVYGPIVIKNNPNLHMPVSDVLAWIAGLRGAVHAVDLSFNSLDGPVSTDICDIYANGTNVVSLRGNSFICGDIPECMRKFWDEDSSYACPGEGDDPDMCLTDDDVETINVVGELTAGTSLTMNSTCEFVVGVQNAIEKRNRTLEGCSPMGYSRELESKTGMIFFKDLDMKLVEMNPGSCTWDADMAKYEGYFLYLEFLEFYTSVTEEDGRGICSEFSSGHNFFNPTLNGPTIREFTVTLYNDTYTRGYDFVRHSGREKPPPTIIKLTPDLHKVKLSQQTSNTYSVPPPVFEVDVDHLVNCGVTAVEYHYAKPLETRGELSDFLAENLERDERGFFQSRHGIYVMECADGPGAITNMSVLSNLTSINGSLVIMDCGTLETLDGLESLVYVRDSLFIKNNRALTDISALRNLKRVGGSVSIKGANAFDDLHGLSGLEEIAQVLEIRDTELKSLSGLDALRTVKGQVMIFENRHIRNMEGLSSLNQIGHSLVVKGNGALTTLSGMEFLIHVSGSVDIQFNRMLANLTGLENLASINGTLGVMNNDRLREITQLKSLRAIAGSCAIVGNRNLKEIDLSATQSIGTMHGYSVVGFSPDLLEKIDFNPNDITQEIVKFGANYSTHILAIQSNENLESIQFCSNCTRLPQNLYINGNERLSGPMPAALLHETGVKFANFANNNFSGQIDPAVCACSCLSYLSVAGNAGVCGQLPPDCPLTMNNDLQYKPGTNFTKPCQNVSPPVCLLEDPSKCTVQAHKYASNQAELPFQFPRYNYSATSTLTTTSNMINYRFGIGTQPNASDVVSFTRLQMSNVTEHPRNPNLLMYTWSMKDKHLAMLNGQTYYITVTPIDILGAQAPNISSSGTFIDTLPPKIEHAFVKLVIDRHKGKYVATWGGFDSSSGISHYHFKLYSKSSVTQKVNIPANQTSIEGHIKVEEGVPNKAGILAFSNAHLASSEIYSPPQIVWKSDAKKDMTSLIVGVVVGGLCAAALVGIAVFFKLKRQKEIMQRSEWLRKLHASVDAYLVGGSASDSADKFTSGDLVEVEGRVMSHTGIWDSDDATFVLTDIQDSTKLCESNASAYLVLQEIHDEIVRNVLAETNGFEVDTEGDAFQCAFKDVGSALTFAFQVQQNLADYCWPSDVLKLHGCRRVESKLWKGKSVWAGPRVRMGIHYATEDDYFQKIHPTTRRLTFGGIAWEMSKALSDVGSGGQVIVSHDAWRRLYDTRKEGSAGYPIFEDLGLYEINTACADGTASGETVRILQALSARGPGIERTFPKLRKVIQIQRGHGLNIVPAPEGPVALVAIIMDQVSFADAIQDFVRTLTEGATTCGHHNNPYYLKGPHGAGEGGGGVEGAHEASINSMDSAARAAGEPYYRSPSSLSHTSSDKKQPHLSLTRMTTLHGGMKASPREKDGGMRAEASAGASASLENLWFHRKANGLLHCEKEAFDIVYDAILSLVSQFGGYIITRVEGRSVPSGLNIVGFKSPSAAIRFGLSAQAKLMEYPWRAEILNSSRMKEVKCKRGFPIFSGPRLAMGGHVTDVGILNGSNGGATRVDYRASIGILQAVELATLANGGQLILSQELFDSNWQQGLSLSQLRVVDLGRHDIRYFDRSEGVVELLPRVLEERSLSFPPLDSNRVLSVGARSAPGTDGRQVALVFTYPSEGMDVHRFSNVVRSLLPRHEGYESQEVGTGCFMLAFGESVGALRFCRALQKGGFRAKLGIVHGSCTKVTPHVATGRADYFGPIVNFTSRLAKSSKPGETHFSWLDPEDACEIRGFKLVSTGDMSFKGIRKKHKVFRVMPG